MSSVVLLLLDIGEWLGRYLMWLADDHQVLASSLCVLFVILVVLAAALGTGAQA